MCQIKDSHFAEKLPIISGNSSYNNPSQQAFSSSSFCGSLLPLSFPSLGQNCLWLKLLPVKRSISYCVVTGFISFVFSYRQATTTNSPFIIEFCIGYSPICRYCNWCSEILNKSRINPFGGWKMKLVAVFATN